jgi:FSR family fosmidomycin resistance protein-like MFS transporter
VLLILGHMVNDMFSNLLSGLLPIFTVLFDLSYVLAGLVAMVFSVTSSLLQPLLGRWFDRTQTTWLLEGGLALNCLGMSLVGISPNYVVLLFLVGTAGIGTAAFHPPAFSTVARSSSASRGGSMGVFLSGGNAGFFLGPIVAGLLVSTFGLQGTLLLLPIGMLTALLLLRVRVSERPGPYLTKPTQPPNRRLLGLLATITALRSITIQVGVTFLPLYLVAKGESLLVATGVASIWLGVGVLGQITGGHLSDRIGRRPVIVFSLFVGAAIFYGFLMTTGLISIILLALSGGVLYASWSVIVTMASEVAPDNVGAVSGFMLGFSIGVGGLAALGFGGTADMLGLQTAFYIFGAFAIGGGVLSLFLPKDTGVVGSLVVVK